MVVEEEENLPQPPHSKGDIFLGIFALHPVSCYFYRPAIWAWKSYSQAYIGTTFTNQFVNFPQQKVDTVFYFQFIHLRHVQYSTTCTAI